MVVNEEVISKWKEEFGSVYHTTIAGEEIYFRTITRDEYLTLMQKTSVEKGFDPEKETTRMCVLNDIQDITLKRKGGISTVIYEQIMLKSGFVTVDSEEI